MRFVDGDFAMMQDGGVDVVAEVTGNSAVGLRHAREAIRNGLHLVMVKVEADVITGALLSKEAKAAGVSIQWLMAISRRSPVNTG